MKAVGHRTSVGVLTLVFLSSAWSIPAHAQESLDPASASIFVTRLYQQVLNREPDPDGLQGFVNQIAQFGSVVPTVLAFFHSQEFLNRHTSNTEFLTILYHTFLDREPDPVGFDAFLGDLTSGLRTRDNLLDIFLDSQEFATLASFLPPQDPVTAFVTNLYVRILGRGPDLQGQQGFTTQLQQSRTVLPTVLLFLHSPEFLNRNTNNTEYVTVLYRVFLDRIPDAAGLAGWVALLNQGTATRDQLAAQFAASPEFQAIQQVLFPPPPPPSIPDIRGTYTVAGTITEGHCENPLNNGTLVFTGDTVTVATQVGANISGTARIVEFINGVTGRIDAVIFGTVTVTGQLSGVFNTSSFRNNIFTSSSTGTFNGSLNGNILTLSASGQQLGSTCTFTAFLSGTR